jgi:hypothetical protein
MNKLVKMSGAALLVAVLVAPSGFAMAASGPVFNTGASATTEDFLAGLGYQPDVQALDHATTVNVVTYQEWNHDNGADQSTTINGTLGSVGSQIADTQKAVSADPAAVKLLKEHGISAGSVAGIEGGRDGIVTLFVM